MDNKHRFLAVLALSVQVSAAQAGVNIGIVRLDGDGGSYLYAPQKIRPGDTVHFQYPKGGKPACCTQLGASAATLSKAGADAVDAQSGQTLYRYRLPSKTSHGSLPFVGIAAIGQGIRLGDAGPWKVKVHEAGATTELSLCTSQEGVRVADDRRGGGHSELYLYLGYDIENPTCPPPGS